MVSVPGFEPGQYPDLGIIEFIRLAMHHTSHGQKAGSVGFEPTYYSLTVSITPVVIAANKTW